MIKEFETVRVAYTEEDINAQGVLSNDGTTLGLNLESSVTNIGSRRYAVTVVFANIDQIGRRVEYTSLYEGMPTTTLQDVEVDLTPVKELLIPRTVDIRSAEINIDLFTYEANVDTTYGSKRISYPYNASVDSVGYNTSTDGVYIINVNNIHVFDPGEQYLPNDIVYQNSLMYMCIVATTSSDLYDEEYWVPWEGEVRTKYAANPPITPVERAPASYKNESTQIYALNSRDMKQRILIPTMRSLSSNPYDDDDAVRMFEYYTNKREAAVMYLANNDIIRCDHALKQIMYQYSVGDVAKPLAVQQRTYINYSL